MLNMDTVVNNSRRGYPQWSGNKLILHDEPQFEGHLFLPGYTIGNLAVLNTTIPFGVEQEGPVENLDFKVIKSNDTWIMHDKFQIYNKIFSTLVAACQEYPKNQGVEAFGANVSQQYRDITGGASHRRQGEWHCDYPWHPMTGWWAYVANIDTTQFALEPPEEMHGVKVENVSEASIWRPEPGELVILDALTTHRIPRCYRRRIPRTLISLEPLFTLKQQPRKARKSMLDLVEIGDYSEVHIDDVIFDDSRIAA